MKENINMVIILRGSSGSGKSMLANLLKSTNFKIKTKGGEYQDPPLTSPHVQYTKQVWDSFIDKEHQLTTVSADDYFMINGEYRFDPKHLGVAHAGCLREFDKLVSNPSQTLEQVIVVDNTNASLPEFVPYAALANAYAHELHIITLISDPYTSFHRNTHGAPMTNVIKQELTLRDSILQVPPWFPQQVFAV